MLAGIAVFGVVSANLAALIIKNDEASHEQELEAKIDELTRLVNQLVEQERPR